MRALMVGLLVVVVFVGLAFAADGLRSTDVRERRDNSVLFVPNLEEDQPNSSWNSADAQMAAKKSQAGGTSYAAVKAAVKQDNPTKAAITPAAAAVKQSEQDSGLALGRPWLLALAGFLGLCVLAAVVWSIRIRHRARFVFTPVITMSGESHQPVRRPAMQTAFVVSMMQKQLSEAKFAESAGEEEPFRRAA